MTENEFKSKIAACAKCGSCRTVCTLYPERRTETNVARGKIALIESSLLVERPPLPGDPIPLSADSANAVRDALADCLLCGRCERNCPNQVAVEEILVEGRARFAGKLGLPAWKRFLFGEILPSAGARGTVRAAGNLAQKLLLRKVPTESGLHYRFPESAGFHGRTLPSLPPSGFVASLAEGEAVDGEAMLFPGCVFDLVMPEIGRAAYETMRAAGVAVSVPRDAACCGLPAWTSGDREGALASIAKNLACIRSASPKAVVFPCGTCLTMFRREMLSAIPERHPLRADAAWVSERCVDYATFILDSSLPGKLVPPHAKAHRGGIGWHDPCHLSGTLGRGGVARDLLARAVGESFREMAGADRCCGYGGTFNARDYPTSAALGTNKVSVAAQGGTSTIVTACSGCILQLRDAAARVSPGTRIRHLAEVVRDSLHV
ncbi:MAG TPA: (Fe-S)-binding protein [Candidatus Deferrimicrobiaceae bacterium]